MASEKEFLSCYERMQEEFKTVKAAIDKAIEHEDSERPLEAIAAYEECLRVIDDIFSIPVELPDRMERVQSEWLEACKLIKQLKALKMDINNRLQNLQKKHVSETNVDAGGELQGTTRTYKDMINGLRQLIANKNAEVTFDTLFQAHTKLYKIEPNGVVNTLARATSMSLVMVTVGGEYEYLNGLCFIQCAMGEEAHPNDVIWIYLLLPTVTHCYRTDYKSFIFPDLEAETAGAAFGLILCKSTEDGVTTDDEELENLQQFFLDLLEAVLAGQVTQLPAEVPCISERISKGIVGAADYLARGMLWGAEKTGEMMVRGTPHIIARLRPAGPEPPHMCTALQKSVQVAQTVTSAAAGVTGWVAGKVGSLSVAIGGYLGPRIQTHGATLLQKGFNIDADQANSKMEGAITIAAGALEGFTTIFNSLETSAKILGTSLSDNSVKIIEHRYGPSAADLASGTFDTIGNAFNVSQNVNYITPKGVAKKLAKNTGKAVVANYHQTVREQQIIGHLPAGALYPELRQLSATAESH